MRRNDTVAGSLFSDVDPAKQARTNPPVRVIRDIVNATLSARAAELHTQYSPFGRESVPPAQLLRPLLCRRWSSMAKTTGKA